MNHRPRRFLTSIHLAIAGVVALTSVAVAATAAGSAAAHENQDTRWMATWVTAPQLVEPNNMPPAPGLRDATLRQTIRVSIGGPRFRLKFSNAFGDRPLELVAVHVAKAAASGRSDILSESDRPVKFNGQSSTTIPPGALMVSDPIPTELRPGADLAVTIRLRGAPDQVTGHPGSRTTSFLQAGDAVAATALPEAARTDHWYFLSGVDVWVESTSGALAILGDSLTDGRGSTTNGNDRWPDQLFARLRGDVRTAGVAVLNQGIGGNRLLRDGLGPSALARLDRDVIAQPGVRWLIVFEGINDIGTAPKARERGDWAASARDLIAAYEQIVTRAHAHGIRVFGATLLPFGGSFYDTPGSEADRQEVNAWIRTSEVFDAVIDFEAAVRDPENPTRLAAQFDDGDHLHLNPAGYRALAEAVDLMLLVE